MRRELAAAEILTSRITRVSHAVAAKARRDSEKKMKMMYTKEQVIESYQKLGSIPAVCADTGCPPYVIYKWLTMSKMLKRGEAVSYGTTGSKNGALAEIEFKRLVPFAMDANKELANNNPVFDFDVGGQMIDVKWAKYGSLGVHRVHVCVTKSYAPDYFVLFLGNKNVDDKIAIKRGAYRVLCIPSSVILGIKSIFIGENSKYWEFEIEPENLADFFHEFLEEN